MDFNKIETFTRNLKSLNVGKEKYGPFLASIVMSKFPNDINLIVSRSMPVNEEWEIEELSQCLKRELESREMCYNMRGGGEGRMPHPDNLMARSSMISKNLQQDQPFLQVPVRMIEGSLAHTVDAITCHRNVMSSQMSTLGGLF